MLGYGVTPAGILNSLRLFARRPRRQGAQQDFQTVAILGFGADAGILAADETESLQKGLRRQAGRGVVIDELPAAFCSDAVGVLGVVLGTKVVGDTQITDQVVQWISKFLKKSYDADRTEEWQRCLFAAVDLQLGSLLNISIPKSPGTADVRTALVARGVMEACDDRLADQDGQHTLNLAMRELPDELPHDRAALRLAAVESVIQATVPVVGGKGPASAPKGSQPLSERDVRVSRRYRQGTILQSYKRRDHEGYNREETPARRRTGPG